jgi:hypothetical protein
VETFQTASVLWWLASQIARDLQYCTCSINCNTVLPLSYQLKYCRSNRNTVVPIETLSYQFKYCHTNRNTIVATEILSYQLKYSRINRNIFIVYVRQLHTYRGVNLTYTWRDESFTLYICDSPFTSPKTRKRERYPFQPCRYAIQSMRKCPVCEVTLQARGATRHRTGPWRQDTACHSRQVSKQQDENNFTPVRLLSNLHNSIH